MKVTPVPHDLDLLASDLVRSPGLHASTIYGDYFKEADPKRYGRGGGPDPVRMALGTAWEKHLEYLIEKAGFPIERPGEFTSPGGWALSPDLVIFNGHTAIGEIKLTWMTSGDAPRKAGDSFSPKYNKYILQMQDGCNAIETSHARLYVYYVNGRGSSFRRGSVVEQGPELLTFDIEFSARELKEAFDLMVNHKRHKGF